MCDDNCPSADTVSRLHPVPTLPLDVSTGVKPEYRASELGSILGSFHPTPLSTDWEREALRDEASAQGPELVPLISSQSQSPFCL